MGRAKLALTVLAILCPTVATWALVDSGVSQAFGADKNPSAKSMGYAGSVSCREKWIGVRLAISQFSRSL